MLYSEIIETVPLVSKKEEKINYHLYNGNASSSILFPGKKHQDVVIHTKSIGDTIQLKLNAIAAVKTAATTKPQDPNQENAFHVCDLGEVVRQFVRWKKWLPRIEPFYAIKCNTDPMVVNLLASLGCGFDCASKEEIDQVLEDAGISPDCIIYANPCKQSSFLQYAAQKNVSCITFDNMDELYKIKAIYPTANLVLRLLVDDSKALYKLGLKFGAALHSVQTLLETAKELELNVIGVSFHVGSGCQDEYAFVDALERARHVFDQARQIGFQFSLLDIGGGFYGAEYSEQKNEKQESSGATTTTMTFEKAAAVLGPAVDRLFPHNVRVIAEPGRYFVSSAFTACVNIIGRRKITMTIDDKDSNDNNKTKEDEKYMYYLNDGVYGTFSIILFESDSTIQPKILLKDNKLMYGKDDDKPCFESSLWGPTCDPTDCVRKSTRLPELNTGDWLYFNNVGAYATALANRFNGFRPSEVSLYTNTYQEHHSQ